MARANFCRKHARAGLKKEYPMVAPNYSKARSGLARAAGLGRKASAEPAQDAQPAAAEQHTAAAAPKRARRSKAKA